MRAPFSPEILQAGGSEVVNLRSVVECSSPWLQRTVVLPLRFCPSHLAIEKKSLEDLKNKTNFSSIEEAPNTHIR